MEYTIYNNTLTQIMRMLDHAKCWLEKAIAYGDEKSIEQPVLAQYRLRPDMLPLAKQIQIACDVAKGCAARLSGQEAPKFEDNEQTLNELIDRIENTQTYLNQLQPEQFEGSEKKHVHLKLPKMSLEFNGANYVNQFVLPNVYFHLTTAYDILRYAGVSLGKMDFLGQMSVEPVQ